MQSRLTVLLACGVSLGLCVGTGCKRDPATREARFLERAKKLMDAKDYSRAALEFRNAAAVNGKRADTWHEMGVAYLGAGAPREAVGAFRRALDIDPSHTAAQLQLYGLMVQSRDPGVLEDAVRRLDQLLATSPEDPEARDLLAMAEMRLNRPEDAEEHLKEALQKFPGRLKSSAVLAGLQVSRREFDKAEKTLQDAVAHAPQSVDAALALAQLYTMEKKTGEAEAELRRALQLDPSSSLGWQALAAIQILRGKPDEADESYRRLASLPKPGFRFAHAVFLLRRGRDAESISEFEKLARESPDDREARLQLSGAYLTAGRRSDGLRVLGELLKKNRKDTDALLLRSRVYAGDGRLSEAEADIQQVLHFKPDSADAHYTLAQLYRASGRRQLRQTELAEALRLNPQALAVRVELAQAQLADGQAAAALATVDGAPVFQQSDDVAVQARIGCLLALGRREEASASIEQALKVRQTASLLTQRGVIKALNKNYAGARQDAASALRENPRHLGALNLFVQSCLAQNEAGTAVDRLRAVVALQPAAPAVQVVAGEWLARLKKPAEARSAFEAAKAAAPGYTVAEIAIAVLDAAENKKDAAKARLAAVLQKEPKNHSAALLLADLEYAEKDYAAALAHYRAVADGSLGNTMALNNTAYLLAASDPDGALRYAERALELAPTDPHVQDTAGWIYCRKGLYSKGIPLLEASVAKAPTNASEFHLAMSYIKSGDQARGRRLLNSVLAKDPNLVKTEQGW